MGLWISRIAALFNGWKGEQARILMLGLDAAGKTTILYKIKLNENICTIPTIGFNVESVEPVKGITFTVWDVGGQDKIRQLWRHYYQNSHGLIYVVDSADRTRFDESREELFNILNSDEIPRGIPFVIIANKQDLPNAVCPAELVDRLQLRQLHKNKWHIQAACAVTADGIYEAMDQLAMMVKEYKKSQH